MLAGHFGAALAARAVAPRVPLWSLVLAVQWIDVLWALFVLAGVEHLRVDPALPSNPLDLYHMPWTHSLAGALVWSALAFALARAFFGSVRTGIVVGAAAFSHWPLDLLVHRPDLPLWPGSAKLGLGLWNHPAAALALELAILLGSAWLLARRVAWGRRVFVFAGALALVHLALTLAPPTLGPRGVAGAALFLFAAATLAAAWIEPGAREPAP